MRNIVKCVLFAVKLIKKKHPVDWQLLNVQGQIVHDYLGQEKFNRTQLCSFCKDIQPGCKTCTGKTFNSNFTLKWNRFQTDFLKNCWKVPNNPLSKQIMRVNLHVKSQMWLRIYIWHTTEKITPKHILYCSEKKKPGDNITLPRSTLEVDLIYVWFVKNTKLWDLGIMND